MNMNVQVAAAAVVLFVLLCYMRNRRLPLLSTKLFGCLLALSLLNQGAVMARLFTFYRMESVPAWLNRLSHQLFIGSLDLLVLCLYFYVDAKANGQRRPGARQLFLRSLPAAAALGTVLFGQMYEYRLEEGRYSYGIMVIAAYASAAAYLVPAVRTMCRRNIEITKEARYSVAIGISAWAVIALYEIAHPLAMISSVANALVVLYLYITFENPRDYRDSAGQLLNRQALQLVLEEMTQRKKEFYLVNFMLEDVESVKSALGHIGLPRVLGSMAQQMKGVVTDMLYHSRSNIISFVCTGGECYEKVKKGIEKFNFEYRDEQGCCFTPRYHICILECPTYAKDTEEIMYFLDYLKSDAAIANNGNIIIHVDEEIISKKNNKAAVDKLVMHALEEDGFEVYYQPIYSTAEKRFLSAEALVRLKDKETLGYVSPEVFVPIAEERGRIRELGNMVLRKVCRFISGQRLEKYGIQYIEVNLSGLQCMDAGLPEVVEEILRRNRVHPSFLNLEITETASVEGGKLLHNNMERLRRLGCQFSMDDFGTGYSNLSKMAEVHFELIKLDKSLIWPCFEEGGEEARIILDNCIRMISELGMEIVAEGVETAEQAEYLTERGVTYLQGYYYSRPLPEQDYLDFLRRQEEIPIGVRPQ